MIYFLFTMLFKLVASSFLKKAANSLYEQSSQRVWSAVGAYWYPWEPELSYRSKFQWLFDQGKGNFARVSREFELSKFELTKGKMTRKWGEIQGKSDSLWVSGEFELSGFESSGFYCIHTISQMASIFQPPCLRNLQNALSPVPSETYNGKTPPIQIFPFFHFFGNY